MVAWNLLSGGRPPIIVTESQQLNQVIAVSAYICAAVGDGDFTCCTRFENHVTDEGVKIDCDKDKIGRVMKGLLERSVEAYQIKNDMQMWRLAKATWHKPCAGLSVDCLFEKRPTTWPAFCKYFKIDKKLGVQPSRRQLRKHKMLPPLYYAVMSCNSIMVEYILDEGADVNFTIKRHLPLVGLDLNGFSALHAAGLWCFNHTKEESEKILKLLIDYGACPFRETVYLGTPMCCALFVHNDLFTQWMYKNYKPWTWEGKSVPSACVNVLGSIALHCDLDLLKEAVADGAGPLINKNNEHGAPAWSWVGEILKKIGNRNFEHFGALRALGAKTLNSLFEFLPHFFQNLLGGFVIGRPAKEKQSCRSHIIFAGTEDH